MTAVVQTSFGIYEAKTHFAGLVERACAGEVLTITRHGRPVARLVPIGDTQADVTDMLDATAKLRAAWGSDDIDMRELIGRDAH